jgi:hypothetical protein
LSLGTAPGAPPSDDRHRPELRALLPWLLPFVAATYLVRFAPGANLDGIPYAVVTLGPVATFLVGSLVVAAIRPPHTAAASRTVIAIGVILAGGAVILAGGEAVHLVHVGLRGQVLLALGVFGGGIVVGGRLAGLSGRAPTAFVVLVAVAVAAMLQADIRVIGTAFDRDLILGLRAGSAMLHGLPAYTDVVLSQAPRDPTLLPFLYPPVTLPFLAALSVLPRPIVESLWLVLAGGASVAALRCFGVRWRWVPVLLIWPPFIQGLWTGNANTLLLLAFAAAPFAPSLLVIPPLVKLQLGVTGLWLPRERRWRALLRGLVAVAALVLVTLPIVGLHSWQDWLRGLAAFAQTSANIRAIEGLALVRYVGPTIAIALAAMIIGVALLRHGRDSLATLGLASIAVSPTLYLHGLSPSLPSLLRLRGAGFWFLLAVTGSFAHGLDWWLLVGILIVAPLIPVLVVDDQADAAVHPIGPGLRPWPMNPFRAAPAADPATPD